LKRRIALVFKIVGQEALSQVHAATAAESNTFKYKNTKTVFCIVVAKRLSPLVQVGKYGDFVAV